MRSRVAEFQRTTAPQVQEKDEAWFLAQLEKTCPEVYAKGKDFLIICPFHADSHPSCGVDRHRGVFRCFACGAGGHWNKLADKIGAKKLTWTREVKIKDEGVGSLKENMSRALTKAGVKDGSLRKKDQGRPLVEPWPEGRDWRGLHGEALHDLGCIRVNDLMRSVERIGLPVRQATGEILGYTCRATDPENAEPKYLPLAADRTTWREKELPAREALFLADQVIKQGWTRVVLVEGPYDALKLFLSPEKIPALAILGTNNWTDIKAAIIGGLGLEAVAVMMDNDPSGWDAQERIVASIKPLVKTAGLALPKSVKDPGGMSPKQLAWLRQRLFSL